MPDYRYKLRPELIWAIVIAGITPLLIALSTFDVDVITDWRVWAIGIVAAMVRAVAAAVMAAIGSGGFTSS